MIERTRDAMLIHAMLLQPEVAPNMRWLGHVDLAQHLADERNIALVDGMAGSLFEWSAPGVYEGHVFFASPVRGRLAIERGRAMLAHMIEHHGAHMIWGAVLVSNRAARWFARAIGLTGAGFHDGSEHFVMEA